MIEGLRSSIGIGEIFLRTSPMGYALESVPN